MPFKLLSTNHSVVLCSQMPTQSWYSREFELFWVLGYIYWTTELFHNSPLWPESAGLIWATRFHILFFKKGPPEAEGQHRAEYRNVNMKAKANPRFVGNFPSKSQQDTPFMSWKKRTCVHPTLILSDKERLENCHENYVSNMNFDGSSRKQLRHERIHKHVGHNPLYSTGIRLRTYLKYFISRKIYIFFYFVDNHGHIMSLSKENPALYFFKLCKPFTISRLIEMLQNYLGSNVCTLTLILNVCKLKHLRIGSILATVFFRQWWGFGSLSLFKT